MFDFNQVNYMISIYNNNDAIKYSGTVCRKCKSINYKKQTS